MYKQRNVIFLFVVFLTVMTSTCLLVFYFSRYGFFCPVRNQNTEKTECVPLTDDDVTTENPVLDENKYITSESNILTYPPITLKNIPKVMEDIIWPCDALGLPPRYSLERGFLFDYADFTKTKALSNADVLLALKKEGFKLTHTLANIGAADGSSDLKPYIEVDEAKQLQEATVRFTSPNEVRDRNQELGSYFGYSFDIETIGFKSYESSGYKLVLGPVSVPNVAEKFETAGVPKNIDFLKTDIDRYDCDLIFELFKAGYKPILIQSEFNVLYPPPLRYNCLYDGRPGNTCQAGIKFGDQCSLSYLSDMMMNNGYILLQFDWWDAWYIRKDAWGVLTKKFPDLQLYDDLTWFLAGFLLDPNWDRIIERSFSLTKRGSGAKPTLLRMRELAKQGKAMNRIEMLQAAWDWSFKGAETHFKKRFGRPFHLSYYGSQDLIS